MLRGDQRSAVQPHALAETNATPEAFAEALLEKMASMAKQISEDHRVMCEQWAAIRDAQPRQAAAGFKNDVRQQLTSLDPPEVVKEEVTEVDELTTFVGEWVDEQHQFYGGSIIVFTSEAWEVTLAKDEPSTYLRTALSPSRWHLIERHGDGLEQHFDLAYNPDDDVLVVSVPDSQCTWTLRRFEGLSVWPEWDKQDQQTSEADPIVHGFTLSTVSRTADVEQSWRNPYAKWRVSWDCLAPLLLLTDAFWIPFQAFNPERGLGVLVWECFGTCYWAMDIGASFATGYFTPDGNLMRDPKKIALRYMKGLFIVDLSLVVLDLTVVVSDFSQMNPALESSSALRIGKAYRVVRIFRLLRVIRILKLKDVQKRLSGLISSEIVSIAVGIGLNMITLIIFLHVSACLWFILGSSSDDPTANWLDVNGVRNSTLLSQYLLSMHWCLGQITPAPMNITPENTSERAFNVGFILVAILGFSTIISSVTASMTRLRGIQYAKFQQWSLLEKFLQQHNVSPMLSVRLTQFLETAVARQKVTAEKEKVTLLKLLSYPLNLELHRECFLPIVRYHHFFSVFAERSRCFSEVCLHAMQTQLYSKQDVLFERGGLAHGMYFQTMGVLFFQRPSSTRWDGSRAEEAEVNKTAIRWVKDHKYFTEGALWVKWSHTGRMCAWTESEVVMVDTSKFRQVVQRAGTCTISLHRAKEFVSEQASLMRSHGFIWDITSDLALADFEPLINPDGSVVDEVQAVGAMESSRRSLFLPKIS